MEIFVFVHIASSNEQRSKTHIASAGEASLQSIYNDAKSQISCITSQCLLPEGIQARGLRFYRKSSDNHVT